MIKKYTVHKGYCNCQPETCCCDDWEVQDERGERVCSFCSKGEAHNLAKKLNGYEGAIFSQKREV